MNFTVNVKQEIQSKGYNIILSKFLTLCMILCCTFLIAKSFCFGLLEATIAKSSSGFLFTELVAMFTIFVVLWLRELVTKFISPINHCDSWKFIYILYKSNVKQKQKSKIRNWLFPDFFCLSNQSFCYKSFL